MTYQVGAENMIDPYIDDALVSLSELRDAQFSDPMQYACGHNFVIGNSVKPGAVQRAHAPSKELSHNFRPACPIKEVSPSKESVKEHELSMQLVSPDASKQSFPQRALYQGSISPSTPTENASLRSYSGLKSMQWRHRDLAGSLKHAEGCRPILSETPKVPTKHMDRTKGFTAQVAVVQSTVLSSQADHSNKHLQFNKTEEVQQRESLPREMVTGA